MDRFWLIIYWLVIHLCCVQRGSNRRFTWIFSTETDFQSQSHAESTRIFIQIYFWRINKFGRASGNVWQPAHYVSGWMKDVEWGATFCLVLFFLRMLLRKTPQGRKEPEEFLHFSDWRCSLMPMFGFAQEMDFYIILSILNIHKHMNLWFWNSWSEPSFKSHFNLPWNYENRQTSSFTGFSHPPPKRFTATAVSKPWHFHFLLPLFLRAGAESHGSCLHSLAWFDSHWLSRTTGPRCSHTHTHTR